MAHQATDRKYEELKLRWCQRSLVFRRPAKTSRDTLLERPVWYLHGTFHGKEAWGEIAPIAGLSPESIQELPDLLNRICQHPTLIHSLLQHQWPSVFFALESMFMQWSDESVFLHPIPINGLVWMNDADTMLREAREKIEAGFSTIKLKVGGLNFSDELNIIRELRKAFDASSLTIRLDANGAFLPQEAMNKLKQLSEYSIHSIEQPIRAGQMSEMAKLAATSPIPIALDEELIGVSRDRFETLLDAIQPAYLVLKPSLHGAFSGCEEWIRLAEDRGIQWWVTSALESSLGLDAIARWLCAYHTTLPQGLGTGSLYTNNLSPAWEVRQGTLVPLQRLPDTSVLSDMLNPV